MMASFHQGSALRQLRMDQYVANEPAGKYSLLSQGIEADMLFLSQLLI